MSFSIHTQFATVIDVAPSPFTTGERSEPLR